MTPFTASHVLSLHLLHLNGENVGQVSQIQLHEALALALRMMIAADRDERLMADAREHLRLHRRQEGACAERLAMRIANRKNLEDVA